MRAPMRSWRTPILCLDVFFDVSTHAAVALNQGPFQVGTWWYLVDPPRSKTRRTPFKLIQRLLDQLLQGQFRFNRETGYVYRPLLVSGADTTGAWRKVYCFEEYPRLFFKLMPSTEDMSYTTEEIRAFRQLPDYTAQFVQEFHC